MNNSYSSGPNSGYMYKRSGSDINEDYTPEESSPSYPAGGKTSFPNPEYQYGARELPTGSDERPGSRTDLRLFPNSNNQMGYRSGTVLDKIGEAAPTFDGVAHYSGSKNELGSVAEYGGNKAPGHSDLGHKNHSIPTGEADGDDGGINQADYVGISLVGKKFKEVNPTAYYVEKDDESDQFM